MGLLGLFVLTASPADKTGIADVVAITAVLFVFVLLDPLRPVLLVVLLGVLLVVFLVGLRFAPVPFVPRRFTGRDRRVVVAGVVVIGRAVVRLDERRNRRTL